jgi:hypothetical protein
MSQAYPIFICTKIATNCTPGGCIACINSKERLQYRLTNTSARLLTYV